MSRPKKTPAPSPAGERKSAAYQRGQETAYQFAQTYGHDELQDALTGFKAGILGYLKEQQDKIDAVTTHLIRAEEVLNP